MKQKLILLMMLACLSLARAQNPINCLRDLTPTTAPARPPALANCNTAIDQDVSLYIPNTSMPTLTYNINFVFLKHPTLPTVYSNCNQVQLAKDADSMIAYCNRKFAASGSAVSLLGTLSSSPPVANPKIRLRRNNVYLPITSLAYGAHFKSDSIFNQLPFDTSTAINMYFYTETDTAYWSGGEASIGKGFAYMTAPPSAPQYAPNVGGYPYLITNKDLFWHELCHLLGYLTDHYMMSPFGNPNGPFFVRIPYNSDPAILSPNGTLGLAYGGYFPDDAAPDSARFYNCANPLDTSNNNVMGNSFCRQVLSARQIAAFHYLVAKNKTKKYTQFNGLAYPYTPSPVSPAILTLTGTQTLYSNSIPYFSLLTIAPGASITINNANIKIPVNGKIIVQPGAKLTLNCVALSCNGNSFWNGIEVWGNPYLPQYIQPSTSSFVSLRGMDANQGMLVLNNSSISGARIGVLAGKRNGSSINYGLSGGGIIRAYRAHFSDNLEDVHMLFKSTIGIAGYTGNLSAFNNCFFTRTTTFLDNYGGYGLTNTMVNLEGVKQVQFYGNYFFPDKGSNNNDTITCIRGSNASIIVSDSSGYYGKNEFDTAYYAIYMTGGLSSIIQDSYFYTRNGIYMSGSNYNKIVRNWFRPDVVSNTPYSNSLRTSIYMNECSNYKIEANTFLSYNLNSALTEGICINNSGPYVNQVYNNSFNRMYQGLWCQNQNYDPFSSTGDGLVLNCNDFTGCIYNIGVQTAPVPGPAYSILAGIGTTQGDPGSLSPLAKVRNTYKSLPATATGNENKFYSNTPNSAPPQVQHGRFIDVTTPKFSVGPQPAFSDSMDVYDNGIIQAPNTKTVYCTPLDTATAWRPSHFTSQISTMNLDVNQLSALYGSQLDRGNTTYLLDLIHSSQLTTVSLKDTLVNTPFLSDTVLVSYFTPTTVPATYLQKVFERNAPVSRRVWALVSARADLSGPVMADLLAKQWQAALSPRAALLAQLSIAKKERSYAIMHKSMAFINDTVPGIKDSLAALISLNNIGDVARQLIELDLAFGDYGAANKKLAAYTMADTARRHKYVDFKNLIIYLMKDTLQLHSLVNNTAAHTAVATAAADNSHPCQLEARNTLYTVFNSFYPEEKLSPPDEGHGSRTRQPTAEQANKAAEVLANGISIYPNPASSEVFVANGSDKNYNLSLVNINGQVLLLTVVKANELNRVDTGRLLNGIYFVNLYEGKTLIKTNKLVIVK